MKAVGMSIVLFASICWAQQSRDFHSASTNVWGEEYLKIARLALANSTQGCGG